MSKAYSHVYVQRHCQKCRIIARTCYPLNELVQDPYLSRDTEDIIKSISRGGGFIRQVIEGVARSTGDFGIAHAAAELAKMLYGNARQRFLLLLKRDPANAPSIISAYRRRRSS